MIFEPYNDFGNNSNDRYQLALLLENLTIEPGYLYENFLSGQYESSMSAITKFSLECQKTKCIVFFN